MVVKKTYKKKPNGKNATGRPSKIGPFLIAFESVVDDDMNAIIYTDEDLFFITNDKLPEKDKVCYATFKKYKNTEDAMDKADYNKFLEIYSKLNKKQREINKRGISIKAKTKKEYQRKYHKEYYYNVIKNNKKMRIHNSFATLLRHHIKNKTGKTFDILGYSVDDLIKHLESKFNKNMTWDNYGKFRHIDHIRPASWFNNDNKKDFAVCWSLDNLQPLEVSINCKKQNYYEG